jgi:hypothetical protein
MVKRVWQPLDANAVTNARNENNPPLECALLNSRLHSCLEDLESRGFPPLREVGLDTAISNMVEILAQSGVENMKSSDATPPYETLEIGTPLDYTSDMYRFYFEVGVVDDIAETALLRFLGPKRVESLVHLAHGYEIDLPIQVVPDLVQVLVNAGVGIYQIVRYAKTRSVW